MAVADLEEEPRGHSPPTPTPTPHLILGKKEEITGGRKAGRTSKIEPHPPPPLHQAQGVDPPLNGE